MRQVVTSSVEGALKSIMSLSWKSVNKNKAYGETFVLYYSAVWISFLAAVVISGWYEQFTPNDYIWVGVGIALPCLIGPLLLANEDERKIPVLERYIVKANIFTFIVGYIGNHFYTHYFYDVLGMKYTGPLSPGEGIEINRVPISIFLFTHPYFMTYHVLAAPVLRVVKSYLQKNSHFMVPFLCCICYSFGILYSVYGDLDNQWFLGTMLIKGSAFYGIFFVVTFPWFFRLDEGPHCHWSLGRVVTESLAAMMVVLLSADFLRLLSS